MMNAEAAIRLMADQIAEFDWAATPLGAAQTWPQSLRTAVDIMLGSGHAMQLAWGPERTILYNDAYAPMLGHRHPAALGLPFREAWPEIWNDIEPLVDSVFAGETVRFEDMPLVMTRNGYPEDTWWNFSYSPVRDETGAVAGLLNVTVDATGKMRAETALASELTDMGMLRDLALRPVTDDSAREIYDEVLEVAIAIMQSQAGTVQVYDPETRSLVLLVTRNFERKMTDHFHRVDAASNTACGIALRTGQRTLIDFDDEADLACRMHVEAGYRSAQATPLVSRSGTPIGMLNTHWSEEHHRPTERQLRALDLLARQAADMIEQRQAVRMLRASEERQAFLLKLSDTLRPLTDAAEIRAKGCELLGKQIGAGRVYYVEYDRLQNCGIVADDYRMPGLPSLAGRYPFEAFQTTYERVGDGRTWVMPGVARDTQLAAHERELYVSQGVVAWVNVPLLKAGQLDTVLCVVDQAAREWTQQEIALIEEVAERLWAAILRGRAEIELRKSEEKLRGLFESMDESFYLVEVMRDAAAQPIDVLYLEENSAAVALVGSVAKNRKLTDINPGFDRSWLGILDGVSRTGKSERFTRYSSLTKRWHDYHVFAASSGSDHVGVLSSDVSEREHAETALRESEGRLAAAFESVPVGVAVIDLSGRIVLANPLFRRFLPTGLIPSRDPDRVGRWRAWDDEGRPIAPNDFPGARALRGQATVPGLDMLYVDDDGREIWTRVGCVPVRNVSGEVTAQISVISDIDALKRNADVLRESEERFQQFAAASSGALWIRDAATMKMEFVSPAISQIYGVDPRDLIDGVKAWTKFILADDRDDALAHLERARQGDSVTHEFRIQRPTDKTVRWVRDISFPLRNALGQIQRIVGIAEDVTEAKLATERQRLLLAELQHRVRNILATIRSMARRSAENSETVEELSMHLDGRISALARTQVILTRNPGAPVDLEGIIREELLAQAGMEGQVTIEGPAVELSPKAAEVVTLALHELATNAVKYGALKDGAGRIAIAWRTYEKERESWLRIAWIESKVKMIAPTPRRDGFGTELITSRVPYELSGTGTLELRPGGIHATIEFPLRAGGSILETAAGRH